MVYRWGISKMRYYGGRLKDSMAEQTESEESCYERISYGQYGKA